MTIRVLIADSHPILLNGLENLFAEIPDIQVVGRCLDGGTTLEKVRALLPDILLLDIRMPVKNGIEVAREMQYENLPTRVVVLTAELDENQLLDAIRAGVQGIILKEMDPNLFIQCIRKVYSGEQWLERGSTKLALVKMLRMEAGTRELLEHLTPREIELVKMVAQGFQNKSIAAQLFISEGTVKSHLHKVYEKLNLHGRLSLLRYAQQKGLV